MSTVYKLPYTGNEIKEKIGQVDKNTTAIGQISEQNTYTNNELGIFNLGLQRGYHIENNGFIQNGDDASIKSVRLTSNKMDLIQIPVGTVIQCSGNTGVRAWYLLNDNSIVGYTSFVDKIIIDSVYEEKTFDYMYFDFRKSDGSALNVNTNTITVIPVKDGVKQVLEKYINPSDVRCWSIHNFKDDLYRKENSVETKITSLVTTEWSNGCLYLPASRLIYRNALTDPLFARCSWLLKVNTVGEFAIGTRDINNDEHGLRIIVNPTDKTIKICQSNWNGSDTVRLTQNFDFNIANNEVYSIELLKHGSEKITFSITCTTDYTKKFTCDFVEPIASGEQTAKLRCWGAIAIESKNGVFYILEMSQKSLVDEHFDLLIIGDSFVDCGTYNLPTQKGYPYLCRGELGTKMFASGHGGSTSRHVLNRLKTDASVGLYKYAIIQSGSNDSVSDLSVEEYKNNILEIVDFIKSNGAEPILVTIPKRTDIDNTSFIANANEWVKSLGYKYIDEYAIVQGANVLDDGTHPNEKGHYCIYMNIRVLIPEVF